MTPLPTLKYLSLLAVVLGHAFIGGYWAATRPEGAGWRFFSWHPFLMMVGTYIYMVCVFVGLCCLIICALMALQERGRVTALYESRRHILYKSIKEKKRE